MKIRKMLWMCLAAGLFIPIGMLYADQCSDTFQKADDLFEAAKKAVNQGNSDRAIALYNEAGEYYEEVANMENCNCPKVAGSARKNVSLCRNNADKYQKAKEKYEAEEKFNEAYNAAAEKFNEGNAYARNKQWEEAVDALEEAAEIWEDISDSAEGGNSSKVAAAARKAREAAETARKYLKEE